MYVWHLQKKHSDPPVSLHGQLLWREFFYTASVGIPNFDKMEGNPVCTQVDWDTNPDYLASWREVLSPFEIILNGSDWKDGKVCCWKNGCHDNSVALVISWISCHPGCCVFPFKARTGFPFIDAVMTQLRQEGWIHHLARHAVACFLTRGDMWISWEEGQKVCKWACLYCRLS